MVAAPEWIKEDRRRTESPAFTQSISRSLLRFAAFGGFFILLDPRINTTLWGTELILGGEGFSPELKGAVVTLMVVAGFTAVKEYWLGSSAGSEKKTDAITRMAEAPVVAPVVVPPVASVQQTGDMAVTADNVVVTETGKS